MKEFLQSISDGVRDIFSYNIETANTYSVPTRHDDSLTFPIGADKKGKLIFTCVLMVDIRNSTRISRKLRKDKPKLGKIYSAFIYAMTRIADEYGFVRNIVGDRVMVVFEPKDCVINALTCAAVMYSVSRKILSEFIGMEEYKIGIGIDYGEMLVLKTGIIKRHDEQSEYKSLVWVGDAANIASKLCDFANREYNAPLYEIKYEETRLQRIPKAPDKHSLPFSQRSLAELLRGSEQQGYEYKQTTVIGSASLSAGDFANDIVIDSTGWKYKGNKVTSFNIQKRNGTASPILISGMVYSELKKVDTKSTFITKFSKKEYPNQPYTLSGVYGAALILPEASQIKTK